MLDYAEVRPGQDGVAQVSAHYRYTFGQNATLMLRWGVFRPDGSLVIDDMNMQAAAEMAERLNMHKGLHDGLYALAERAVSREMEAKE